MNNATVIDQLATHYPGRHDASRIWRWAGLDPQAWLWQGDAHSSWEHSCGAEPAPLALLKQVLFDHPSDPVYRAALPKASASAPAQRLALLLTCCDHCQESDRPYRLGQWLPLNHEASTDQVFIACIPYFHRRWAAGDRQSLHQQLDLLAEMDGCISSLDETVDGAIALLNVLGSLPDLSNMPAPWQADCDRLHRLLAHVMTQELRFEHKPDNGEVAADRSMAIAHLNEQSPELIARLDADFADQGIDCCGPVLIQAMDRIQRAFCEQEEIVPTALVAGLRQALWGTEASDHSAPWTWQVHHEVEA